LTPPAAAEASGPVPRATWSAGRDPLARAVFALLVVACLAAFFVTQRLKHTPTAVQNFERTPGFQPGSADPERRQERISFKLATADDVTVTIVDSSLDHVATLVRDFPVPRYKQFSLRWNGRRGDARRYSVSVSSSGHRTLVPANSGPLAPPGEYRVRVQLRRQRGAIYSPSSFVLEGP
jgi:hypothetical protein